IHSNSPRAGAPFVEINCAAIPSHLLEAEMFGYEKGAFTDARVAKPGLFEAANGGTLFLDEIGDMLPELQGKLLRVLETRAVRRLGSLRETPVDVRIVAATHHDLGEMVGEGRFREDLFYRLSVVPIELPPLRDRGEDILILADHLLDKLSQVYHLQKPPLPREVAKLLLAHAWPGNVRELKNSLERALVLGRGNGLNPEHLFLKRNGSPALRRGVLPFPASLAEVEVALAHELLHFCDGNKSEAARTMGVSRRHFYVLLRQGETDEQ
ncbi:MAG TPA: sigma 54-interacting transcriptional regulator, partial [Longimicrobiaceae bacterium]|nr:sigma 54-interacting transcriptional regulator [Longimicrobiaceae bacterium]